MSTLPNQASRPAAAKPHEIKFYRRGQEQPTIGPCGEGGIPFFLRIGLAQSDSLPVVRYREGFGSEYSPLPQWLFDARPTPCQPIVNALNGGNFSLKSADLDPGIPVVVELGGRRDAYRIRRWSRHQEIRNYPHDTWREGSRRSVVTSIEMTGVALKPADCTIFTAIVIPDASGDDPEFILRSY
jgi:hypothetical protein